MGFELNINTIRNFVTVAEEGNITNAAEKLFITQPTLSRQIAGLEHDLQVPLLERKKSGVTLTAQGKIFLSQCQIFVRAYDDLIAKVDEFHDIISGNLKIGYQKSSEEILVSFNGRFSKMYPKVSIKNSRQAGDNFVNLLLNGDVDAAFLYGLELNNMHKGIKYIKVGELENMLLVSTENPLAKRKKVHISELREENFILPSKANSPVKTAEIIKHCKENGFEPNVAMHAETIIDYVMGIVQYNGIAVLPYMRNMADSDEVVYLELEGYPVEYPICLAWKESNTNSALPIYTTFVQEQPIMSPPVRK